ncbi:MAG: ribbon-helix-helix protein, CopG family [Nanoarchaeota archaeon]|nr:ribbon-helix-helix protein, CopG family [Nanoarchaeota archaeon]
MAEVAEGMFRLGFRMPRKVHRALRLKAKWEHRSCSSLMREALNGYLTLEKEKGRLKKAFQIIDDIFSGGKKHGILFLDVLSQWLEEDEETCRELVFMAVRILRDYGVWTMLPSVNKNAIRYEINDARSWSQLLRKYKSIKRKFKNEKDAGYGLPDA